MRARWLWQGRRRWRLDKILIRIWDGTYLRLPGDAGCGLAGYGGEGEDGCMAGLHLQALAPHLREGRHV